MGYVQTIRSYKKEVRVRGGGWKTVNCEERQYTIHDDGGQYQLWMDGGGKGMEYVMNITSIVLKRSKDHVMMSFINDKAPVHLQAMLDELQRLGE